MASKKRKTTRKRATKKTKRAGTSVFKIASRNKSYVAAKKAAKKAATRQKAAWKKAVSSARKKLR